MYRSLGGYGSYSNDRQYATQDSTQSTPTGGRYGAPTSELQRPVVPSFSSYSSQASYVPEPRFDTTASPRTGTREKKYQCPQCQKRFERPSAVVTHMRSHTGEKPFGCSHCDKSFSINSNRIRHERTFHAGANAGAPPPLQPDEGEFVEEEPSGPSRTSHTQGLPRTTPGLGVITNGVNVHANRSSFGNAGRYAPPSTETSRVGTQDSGRIQEQSVPASGGYSSVSAEYSRSSGGNLSGAGGYGVSSDASQLRGRLDYPTSMSSGGEYLPRRSEYSTEQRARGLSGSSYGAGDYDTREIDPYQARELGAPRGRPGSSGSFGYKSEPSSGEFSPAGRDIASPSGSGMYGSPPGFGPQSYDSGSSGLGGAYGIGAATSNVRGSHRSSGDDHPESLRNSAQAYYSRSVYP